MKCIKSIFKESYEIKKSKFISYLIPIDKFKEQLICIREDNPKANHIVYAYRELNDYKQIVENSSDDGEPKGAAGIPTLNYLRGANLINCAIVTVRYFGGIKLGVGGMVRAYGSSAKRVIQSANLVEYEELIDFKIVDRYSNQRKIEYILSQLDITPENRSFFDDRVEWNLKISEIKLERLKKLLV